MFANVYMQISLFDGTNPRIKGILCNSEKEPLLFFNQLEALNFWTEHKHRFNIDSKYYYLRGIPKIIRTGDPDDILFNMLEAGERVYICANNDFILYSDIENGTEIML